MSILTRTNDAATWRLRAVGVNSLRRACKRRGRHGLASLMAMLFLILFATLAVGFYTASALSSQISGNEKKLALAQSAAEAGTQYLRYRLYKMVIDPTTPDSALMNAVAADLNTQMNQGAVMNGSTVTNSGGVIYIPSASGWSTIDSTLGTKFRAKIEQSGKFLVVTVNGAAGSSTVMKAVQLQYQKAANAGAILDYGVAARGTVSTAGATYIQGATDPTKGSVLSADLLNPVPIALSGKAVSGDVSIVNPSGSITVASGTSVGGTTDPTKIPSHLHVGVPSPTFPWIDTSAFSAYATNPFNSSMTTLTNVVIPPNTNPKFSGNVTINGVLYIQTPNVVSFKGNATVNGVIVTDTSGSFDPTNNQIVFSGSVSATPLSAMPTSNPAYNPNLVKLTGSFLLAPTYALTMTGDFGTVGGSIVAGTVKMSGNATGTVQGSVIAMNDSSGSGSSSSVYLNGSADIIISSTGTTNYPTGMSFGNDFTPLPGTYAEVTPW
jgi:Tfp pilus assembly protein PilX